MHNMIFWYMDILWKKDIFNVKNYEVMPES